MAPLTAIRSLVTLVTCETPTTGRGATGIDALKNGLSRKVLNGVRDSSHDRKRPSFE